jgi:hypothetical protein
MEAREPTSLRSSARSGEVSGGDMMLEADQELQFSRFEKYEILKIFKVLNNWNPDGDSSRSQSSVSRCVGRKGFPGRPPLLPLVPWFLRSYCITGSPGEGWPLSMSATK